MSHDVYLEPFTSIYGSGTTSYVRTTATTLDYSHYDNNGVLSAATTDYYTCHYLYVGLDFRTGLTEWYLVYDRSEYASLSEAQDSPILSENLAPEVTTRSTGRFISRIIVKNETLPSVIADIQSPFVTTLSSTAASVHNSLGGLQGGTSGEYFHLTSNNYITLRGGSSDASSLHNHNTQYYTKIQSDNNFLSANTSFYTELEANNNFLSADTSFYTELEVDNNFLSANTSFYTELQSDNNFLSANTFDTLINTNGIDNTGNITAATYYGDGSNLTGLVASLDGLTDTTIRFIYVIFQW